MMLALNTQPFHAPGRRPLALFGLANLRCCLRPSLMETYAVDAILVVSGGRQPQCVRTVLRDCRIASGIGGRAAGKGRVKEAMIHALPFQIVSQHANIMHNVDLNI